MLNWAIGEHSDKAQDLALLDSSTRKIMWLDIKKILDLINSRGGPVLTRVPEAKKHFESGGWMDPSEIKGFSRRGSLIVEGKHRLKAALELGETHSPFSIRIDLLDQLQGIV